MRDRKKCGKQATKKHRLSYFHIGNGKIWRSQELNLTANEWQKIYGAMN
jgi:hypothetical protein